MKAEPTYLLYSPAHDHMPIEAYEDSHIGSIRPIQNHVVVCDAATGDIYTATSVQADPNTYFWTDVQIQAKIDRDKLVYFEYTDGPANMNDILSRIKTLNLSDKERETVLSAYAEYVNARQ